MVDFAALAERYRSGLLENILPFWLHHSIDRDYGGFLTCLDRYGVVYDTDKFVWLQGRQVWTYAMAYNRISSQEASADTRQQWLETALHGAAFLERYGADAEGNYYFALTQDGKPLVQPYNIFSDCFATMGFAQLSIATGGEEYSQRAKTIFENILRRQHNWKGVYNKAYPGTRPLKNFSLPMILCNLTLELEHVLPAELVERTTATCVHEVMNVFLQKNPDGSDGLILENVLPDGSPSDSFDGRLLNPGHGIEAMWFIMDIARRTDDKALMKRCVETTLRILEHAWDKEFGGIMYFLDIQGHPPQQLEWDQKLWWVHVESLVALAKGYLYTRDQRCLEWFERVEAWSWEHFADAEAGEWFGYLNRRGEVLLPLKGGKWKGCFHMPRSFYQLWRTFEELAAVQAAGQTDFNPSFNQHFP
jgi:N-acylglucosamine 2-epimerase